MEMDFKVQVFFKRYHYRPYANYKNAHMRITGSHSFFPSDNATYWPGMQNTAFLVIFVDLSVQKYFCI